MKFSPRIEALFDQNELYVKEQQMQVLKLHRKAVYCKLTFAWCFSAIQGDGVHKAQFLSKNMIKNVQLLAQTTLAYAKKGMDQQQLWWAYSIVSFV